MLSFLSFGTTFALFHSPGNIPDVIDMLKILVRGEAMAGAAICNNLGGKPSRSTALSSSNESNFFKTYSKSTRGILKDTLSSTLELTKNA